MNPAGAVAFFDRTTVADVREEIEQHGCSIGIDGVSLPDGKVTVTIAITLTPAIAARMNEIEGKVQ